MKKSRTAAFVFGLLLVGYIVFLTCTISLLPERMATHFDASGQANGWMNRSSAVVFQGVVGLILPLIIVARVVHGPVSADAVDKSSST